MATVLTSSQVKHVELAEEKLLKRRIVFFQGEANGKTTMLNKLVHKIRKDGMNYYKMQEQNWKLEVLQDLRHFPSSQKLNATYLMRLIIECFGTPVPTLSQVKVEQRFRKLLMDLKAERIIPVLAFDNTEAIPKPGYPVLKFLNEYRSLDDKPIGMAIALAGDYLNMRRKMPWEFLEKCMEITVERVESSREIKDILQLVFPDDFKKFQPQHIEQLKRCRSIQQMMKAAELSLVKFEDVRASDTDVMPADIVSTSVTRAQKIVKLAA